MVKKMRHIKFLAFIFKKFPLDNNDDDFCRACSSFLHVFLVTSFAPSLALREK